MENNTGRGQRFGFVLSNAYNPQPTLNIFSTEWAKAEKWNTKRTDMGIMIYSTGHRT